MQKSGAVTSIQCQDHVYLTKARIGMIPDFRVTLFCGSIEWHEAKGFETTDWNIKKRLWKHYGPGKLLIWKRSGKSIKLAETIAPSDSPA
jgi:hypothetical protein